MGHFFSILTINEVVPTMVREVPLGWYLTLSIVLFGLGGLGVVTRRNPVVVFMCVELMLNAVNLSILAFAAYVPNYGLGIVEQREAMLSGQMLVIFVMAIAAAEVAVGLGIIMTIFRRRNDVDVDEMSSLRG